MHWEGGAIEAKPSGFTVRESFWGQRTDECISRFIFKETEFQIKKRSWMGRRSGRFQWVVCAKIDLANTGEITPVPICMDDIMGLAKGMERTPASRWFREDLPHHMTPSERHFFARLLYDISTWEEELHEGYQRLIEWLEDPDKAVRRSARPQRPVPGGRSIKHKVSVAKLIHTLPFFRHE